MKLPQALCEEVLGPAMTTAAGAAAAATISQQPTNKGKGDKNKK